ncbi:MAG: pyridoxamine 5'-phosphate oxidase family protein [Firmicutes bacterium]|nr:pyridoxamine 5'-phosphate oxidase family protein [Bacillota bacterium]
MTKRELIQILEIMIDETRVGILSTADEKAKPHITWLTPALQAGRPDAIFSITGAATKKVANLKENPHCQWVFQNRSISEVLTLNGVTNIIDNPSLKTEIIQSIGKKLTVFWKLNQDMADYVVLETIITDASYFRPSDGMRESVKFREEV